jgi:hypothetical protein
LKDNIGEYNSDEGAAFGIAIAEALKINKTITAIK